MVGQAPREKRWRGLRPVVNWERGRVQLRVSGREDLSPRNPRVNGCGGCASSPPLSEFGGGGVLCPPPPQAIEPVCPEWEVLDYLSYSEK